MGEPKKKEFDDPLNAKIQHKFDLVFSTPGEKSKSTDDNKSTVFKPDSSNDDFRLHEDSAMSGSSAKKQDEIKTAPALDFDKTNSEINLEFDNTPAIPTTVQSSTKTDNAAKLAVVPDDNGLDFTLDFGDDSPEIPAFTPEETAAESTPEDQSFEEPSGLEIPAFEVAADDEMESIINAANEQSQNVVSDGTQKTIVFDPSKLPETDSFEFESAENATSSSELMSKEEEKANIESTIKDILRPKQLANNTQEIDISGLEPAEDFGDFSFDAEKKDDGKSTDPGIDFNAKNNAPENESSEDFDFSAVEFADKETPEEIAQDKTRVQAHTQEDNYEDMGDFTSISQSSSASSPVTTSSSGNNSYVSDEESTRVQATIRQLREEREELLGQIKILKGGHRELEQDNLTLKAALDETKIEVSILRKRHMVELEDIKYRLSINEEKKSMAEEKARQAEGKREKLEQRVRIDFNQVKQREKELETRLEMLTIDVDSQVQSRDQKILELRRKIDSLEFNMENVSIKEHKSQDDKRKLEDKLNKIMKTLRHSIKNLEDDIDQATDAGQDDRSSLGHRSGKA